MKVRSNYRYHFDAYTEDGYAIVEASVVGDAFPSYTLKVPMTAIYAKEVSYILDSEDWSEEPQGIYRRSYDHNTFIAGDTPKLVSWWVNSLPNTTTYAKMRRKNWRRHLRKKLETLFSGSVIRFIDSLRSLSKKGTGRSLQSMPVEALRALSETYSTKTQVSKSCSR